MDAGKDQRYSVQRTPFKRGFEWIDWADIPKEKCGVPIVGILDEYTNLCLLKLSCYS